MLELVVARYRENLNWLRKVPPAIQKTVYDKSGEPSPVPTAILLPNNAGREAHTYLHHIITRHDSLADWTIFCQGKPFDHTFDFHHTLRAFAANPDQIGTTGLIESDTDQFRWLGHIVDTDDNGGQRLFRTWSKNDDGRGLDLNGFHRALLGTDGPDNYPFVLGAQFAVRRDLVQKRPLSFYEQALHISVNFPDAAHCFERTWDKVFGIIGLDANWLAGRQTVYLKPVKQQLIQLSGRSM
jgi:Protein of unknown function (DUF3431)